MQASLMPKSDAGETRTPRKSKRPLPKADKLPSLPIVRPGYYRGDQYRTEDSVGFLMKQVVEQISRNLDARMAEHSLTNAQWRPLLLLSRNSPGTVTQIARWVGCDAGATTRMLDRLEDKGLLRRVRSTDDRRVQRLELTQDGRKAAAIVPYVIADVLNAHLADLSRKEIEQLRELLQRVLAAGRRLDTRAATAELGV
ncbi:MAG TPA: MarR family winged helix-turn-helix transcriptional regulator [Burkholderiaceae bacterium]|nr:MarR family winged helix-turn-helix transcriptional regulator [Burkholderiaceae bacterium]